MFANNNKNYIRNKVGKFYNKLLGCVTLFRIRPGATWYQPVNIW